MRTTAFFCVRPQTGIHFVRFSGREDLVTAAPGKKMPNEHNSFDAFNLHWASKMISDSFPGADATAPTTKFDTFEPKLRRTKRRENSRH